MEDRADGAARCPYLFGRRSRSERPAEFWPIKKAGEAFLRLYKRLAATYSRGSYTTTTIGLAAFDCRVRNGNGSDHCGNATKKLKKNVSEAGACKAPRPAVL